MQGVAIVRSRVKAATLVAALIAAPALGQPREATPDLGTGPNYRAGAPYRAKLSPPHAEGTVLVVRGQVRDATTGKGVSRSVLDAFQADARGHYDTDGFEYRGRVPTDEAGHFEFETVVPSSYGPPPHIHMIVSAPGYHTIRTEMRFRDREHPTNNRPELTPDLVERTRGGKTHFEATFDLALRPEG
jgi:protocatechuate 3,4-dioxygenase beta subunit